MNKVTKLTLKMVGLAGVTGVASKLILNNLDKRIENGPSEFEKEHKVLDGVTRFGKGMAAGYLGAVAMCAGICGAIGAVSMVAGVTDEDMEVDYDEDIEI